MTALPILYMREWSTLTPESPGAGAVLRGIRLTAEDRAFIATLEQRSSLRFVELRDGLSISVGPHIGTVSLSGFRVVVMPKLRIDNLMRMVAYAFDLSDIAVSESLTSYRRSNAGLVDLLGLSLLREVERIARSGLLPNYEARHEDLATPRGRLDLRHAATHPRSATLRCTYHDLTVDHRLHQILAEGLRVAANVMDSSDVRLALARAADRFFGDITRLPLDSETMRAALEALDRRSSHYRAALTLVQLIAHGARLGDHMKRGAVRLSSFTLNMNLVFERFLGRYLVEHAPAGLRVSAQDVRSDVFRYVDNASRWRQPTIRPDFVIRGRTGVVAVADAKYKNRHEHPPSSGELYQLTTYGLAYAMPQPRDVLLLHPVSIHEPERAATLVFAPTSVDQHVRIRLVGVPIDGFFEKTIENWWPLERPHHLDA